ncbi:hypothetical protein ACH5RR_015459 [Cinchona calisaya]|uniref:Uncharacterized protein n=1 Tax=Cinchona calisaya TaxID=153742 RepID=A0ABD2ZWD4_9GENT
MTNPEVGPNKEITEKILSAIIIKKWDIKSYCRVLKREQAEDKGKCKKQEKNDEEQTTKIVTGHDDMFVFYDDDCIMTVDWIVDSGVSFHGEDIDDVLVADELDQEPPLVQPPQDQPRRSTRDRRLSSRYNPNEYLLLTDRRELESCNEALEHK